MRHDFQFGFQNFSHCLMCGVPEDGIWSGACPGKPAGNTGRHETPSETGLWDRLRADLNNLGAAYGPITEGAHEVLVTPEPVEIYERAAWDLPITFTARLGGRTP